MSAGSYVSAQATASAAARCGKCYALLPGDLCNRDEPIPCPSCGTLQMAWVFPAAARPHEAGRSGRTLLSDDQAGCFYHPNKQASVPCDRCGRFLCDLCDVRVGQRHYCPQCLDQPKEGMVNLQNSRVLYDKICLSLAVVPLVLGLFPSLLGAPAAVVMCFIFWRRPPSLLGGSGLRRLLALILGVVQIFCWTWFFYSKAGA
ncbi:MAG: hypothetical protein LLG01_10390 [Planctomycetaceae bacterium]|nr:hypothetical protein [Planctomycetaceae bacterium]